MSNMTEHPTMNGSLVGSINASINATITVHVIQRKPSSKASIFELVVLGLLTATILVGNSLVCLAFKSVSRRLKSITNSFVISLAASDILVGAFSLPLWAVFRMGYIVENTVPYYLYIGLDIVCGSASIMNLTMISLERMYAVRFPAKHRNIAHKRGVIICGVTLVWLFSLSLAGLSALKITNIWPGYTYMVVVFAFLLPTFIIVISYLLIFHTMKYRQEQHWRFKQEMRLAVMIGIVIILFLICWFPFFLFNIVFHHTCPCKNNHFLYPIIPVIKYMHYSNSLMNPIIYAYRYPDYRQAFKKMLISCYCTQEYRGRQRTASIRSTFSSTMPSAHDEHMRDRELSSTHSRSPSRLYVSDSQNRVPSDEKLLLTPNYSPIRCPSPMQTTTSV